MLDPVVRAFWEREFAEYDDKFRREAVAPILNKINKVLLPLLQSATSSRSRRVPSISALLWTRAAYSW